VTFGLTILDCEVLTVDEARVFQALQKRPRPIGVQLGCTRPEKADNRHRRLLRARRQRERGRRSGQPNEISPPHGNRPRGLNLPYRIGSTCPLEGVSLQSADVRFGSKADICSAPTHVRFTPNSDRESGFPQTVMTALPPKADMCSALAYVCFGPKADFSGGFPARFLLLPVIPLPKRSTAPRPYRQRAEGWSRRRCRTSV
jgi:hypothetical protein